MLNLNLNKGINSNILIMFVVFIILGPNLGSGLDISILSILTLFLIFISVKKTPVILNGEIYLLLILFVIALLSSIWNGGQVNTSFLLKPLKLIFYFFVFYSLAKYTNNSILLKSIFIAGAINALIVYLQLFNIIDLYNPQFILHYDAVFRKPGLFAGYPDSGLLAVISSLVGFYLFKSNKNILYIIFSLLIAITVLVTARTAMLLFMIAILFYYFIILNRSEKIKMLIYISIFLMFIYFLSFFLLKSELLDSIYNFSFELFNNFSDDKGLTSKSSNDLINNHYTLPKDIITFFIGNSIEPFSISNYYFSDVFYVRTIWGNGFFSLIIYFLLCLLMIYKLSLVKTRLSLLVSLLIFLMLITCFKGPFYFSRGYGDSLILLYFIALSGYEEKSPQ